MNEKELILPSVELLEKELQREQRRNRRRRVLRGTILTLLLLAAAGIIAAPVGFVHVKESKHMVKPFKDIPKIIVEGRKGGSNLAATLCNAILTFDDAAQLKPGRDL